MTPVRLEPAAPQSRVKHSTIEPLRSLIVYPLDLNSIFRHLKRVILDYHMNFVLVPADKAANNVVVV